MCDVMVDLETLSKKPNATILTISAIHFDPYGDYIGKTFTQTIDIDSCISYNLSIEAECLHFWIDQPSQTKRALSAYPIHNLHQALLNFTDFLKKLNPLDNVRLWGNGINFDNVILKSAFLACGLDYPIHYKNDRDVRTICNLIPRKEFNEIQNKIREDYKLERHNSLDDAKFQILYLQKIYKRLNLKNYK